MNGVGSRTYWANHWARALRQRSGQQCRGFLHTPDGQFCADGVLCDELMQDGIGGTAWEAFGHFELMAPPVGTVQFAHNLFANTPLDLRRIADMNDTGATFEQIADYIERHSTRMKPDRATRDAYPALLAEQEAVPA